MVIMSSRAKIVNDYKYRYIEKLKMNFDREIISCKYFSKEKLLIHRHRYFHHHFIDKAHCIL